MEYVSVVDVERISSSSRPVVQSSISSTAEQQVKGGEDASSKPDSPLASAAASIRVVVRFRPPDSPEAAKLCNWVLSKDTVRFVPSARALSFGLVACLHNEEASFRVRTFTPTQVA